MGGLIFRNTAVRRCLRGSVSALCILAPMFAMPHARSQVNSNAFAIASRFVHWGPVAINLNASANLVAELITRASGRTS